jgi:hypothetical protein
MKVLYRIIAVDGDRYSCGIHVGHVQFSV